MVFREAAKGRGLLLRIQFTVGGAGTPRGGVRRYWIWDFGFPIWDLESGGVGTEGNHEKPGATRRRNQKECAVPGPAFGRNQDDEQHEFPLIGANHDSAGSAELV